MKHNGRDEFPQPFKEGKQAMYKARRDGLYLLLLGSLVFLLFGVAFESLSPVGMVDFGVLYFPTRTLLHHVDPYSESEVLHTFNNLSTPIAYGTSLANAFS